jgi:AraC-like DNA-binding protein
MGESSLFITNCNYVTTYTTKEQKSIKGLLIPKRILSYSLIESINNASDIYKHKNSIIDLLNIDLDNSPNNVKEWAIHGILALLDDSLHQTTTPLIYKSILDEIEINYLKHKFTLANLALKTNISQRKIQTVMNNNNTTFKKTLSRLRCEHMQHLIYTTESTLEYISWNSGFSSYATAKRNFVNLYKSTPKKYKATIKNN